MFLFFPYVCNIDVGIVTRLFSWSGNGKVCDFFHKIPVILSTH